MLLFLLIEWVVNTVSTIIEELGGVARVVLIVWTLLPFYFLGFVLAQADIYAVVLDGCNKLIRNEALFGEEAFAKQERVLIDFGNLPQVPLVG
jgi:hypothetical protein